MAEEKRIRVAVIGAGNRSRGVVANLLRDPKGGVEIPAAYDPDAEITGLTLTVPSWVSSIERARQNSNLANVSQGAKRNLGAALQSLQDKISEMLLDIEEGR